MAQRVDRGHEVALETEPLLPSALEATDELPTTSSSSRTRCTWHWINVVALCVALAVIGDMSEYLVLAPRVRLYESILCTDYYLRENPSLVSEDGSVPERFCKVDYVQDQIAMIQGWNLFFESIPAILLPVPYGYLADKYGRKWFMSLSLFGCILAYAFELFVIGVLHLPLQYIWLSSPFYLIGGGPFVAASLLSTIIADVTPPEKRSAAFFYRFTSNLIAECVTPPITSILMARSPWIPLLLALLFVTLCFAMTLALPETLPVDASVAKVVAANHNRHIVEHPDPIEDMTPKSKLNIAGDWKQWTRETRESFAFITHNATIAALVLTFLISRVGRHSINLLLQYVSKRYKWSLSKAGLLLSLRAGVNIVLFTIVLPSIATSALSKLNVVAKDVWISRASITLMFLGAVVLSASATPALMIVGLIIYTLGTGFPPVVRSLVTSLVESYHASKSSDIGRLYALISVLEGVGNLIAGPGMAQLFRYGINLGTNWLGLPFALAALLFALISPVVFMMNT